MKYNRISADCHLDMPWMPPDLFTSMAPRDMKDRMPFVIDTDEGPKWTANNGASFGFKNGVGPAGSKYQKGKHHRVDVMAETGLYEDGAKDIRRVSDPHLRIKDLDRDGVDAEVIYGILGASSRLNDKDASNEMLRIYNDWLKDFCSHYPDRHIGLACLPYGDIDAAVKEIHRVAKMGIRGLELSCSWDMEPMWHPMWEPLWKAVNDVQLPLHFHTFPTVPPDTIGKYPGRVGRSVFFTVVSGFQMNLVNILAAIIAANVLERYPQRPHRLRRVGLRLDPLCARPHGLRMGGPLHRPRPQDEAVGLLAPPVQGDLPVRPHRRQADRRHGRGEPDVGLRLPARRRRVAELRQVHQGAVRRGLARGDAHDHLHQRRQVLRPDQLIAG